MFGRFAITYGDVTVSDSFNRTRQLWNLLEYLVANRHKMISQQELISILWPNESSENPVNALKNLVYRIRTMLSQYGFPFARDAIQFSRGSYCWNNTLPCRIDAEEFERLIAEGKKEKDGSEHKINTYLEAISLYEGDFLPSSSYESWVVSLGSYYRTLYFQAVFEVLDMLFAQKRFGEAQHICERAIVVDPFDDRAHQYMIMTLIRQNRQAQALEHYNRITDLFYRELGVRPSEAMRALYREITKSINNVETDLGVIKEDLSEHNSVRGAFYCDYEVFRNMYRVEARAASRSGQAIFLGLLTVTTSQNQIPDLKSLGRAMDILLDSSRQCLRKGDVISRFSPTQYVLLLYTQTFENGQRVLDRLQKFFHENYRPGNIRIHTNIQPVTPVDV